MSTTRLSPLLLALLVTSAYADAPATTPVIADPNNSVMTAPPAHEAASSPESAVPTAAPAVDCNTHIPASQVSIDGGLISAWAKNAVLQSFNFTPATIQAQLDALKPCYTEQGWKGFSDALQKSGNVDSIKSQQLNVSSQSDGEAAINTVKDNQWKITLPVQVVYQNDKEKVTQQLKIEVLVGRKPIGDLGIMQMIATTLPPAEPAATTETPAAEAPASTTETPAAEAEVPAPTTETEAPATQQPTPESNNNS